MCIRDSENFWHSFPATELGAGICLATQDELCQREETCLICAAFKNAPKLAGARAMGRKMATALRALLSDPQYRIGWDARNPPAWSESLIWGINNNKSFRKEISRLGAIEIDKTAMLGAIATGSLKSFVVEATLMEAVQEEYALQPKMYWSKLHIAVWKLSLIHI